MFTDYIYNPCYTFYTQIKDYAEDSLPNLDLIENYYRDICDQCQSTAEEYLPDLPKDSAENILQSAAYSFAISLVLSGGNPFAAVKGGVLVAIASLIHVVILGLMKTLEIRAGGNEVSSEGKHLAFIVGWASGIYLGQGMGIHNKLSFFTTIIPCLWKISRNETPWMAITVI